ncbi:uncharacterized protein LOC102679218 [Apis dorsata]|uniref:uncharacterized protein LOC102679218 n=1 Tax=Apis dorsata TaxID=7462 RepID=UPI001293B0F8|nr:uncharacterized protein LOC102679218 [Apis dorsata]
MNLESYNSCYEFYTFINTKLKTCVSRDPTSLLHLNNALLIWQLRMNVPLNYELVKDVNEYVKDVISYNFSQFYCSIKGLESYLLILYRRLDIPHSYDLFERTYYAKKIIKFLHNVSIYFPFVKPFTYFLESYMRLLRGRKSSSQTCMAKAEKYAIAQGNKMVIAWIEQNKRTWEVDFFNNMAEYWVEFVASSEGILWQEIHLLKPIAWSTILYPYPHPKYNY